MQETNNEYRWLNTMGQSFLDKDYLLPGQSVDERVKIIAHAAEKRLKIKGFADKFIEYFKKGWFSLSTPIWTNFGTDRGLPISCFGSYMEDNLESILGTQAEVGMMTKYGGGTSGYFGELRGRGQEITNNGKSSGAVHFMQLFESTMNVISQGSTRRGSFAAYLPIEHPDVEEFLSIRDEGHPIQTLSFGVTVSDKFMKEMIAGDKDKRTIWARVIEARLNTGYPYILFTDNANKGAADVYKNTKQRIVASNLCVTGDQLVPTNRGLKTVKELADTPGNLILFDGEKLVDASSMVLIEHNAEVFSIQTEDGREHKVTGYHKLKTIDGMVEAKNLKIGDKLYIQKKEGIFGLQHMPQEAFVAGLYQGDGTQYNNLRMIDIWENDFDLIPEIQAAVNKIYNDRGWNTYNNRSRETPIFLECQVRPDTVRKQRLTSTKLEQIGLQKGVIPKFVLEGDKDTQAQYLRGLYYADGTVRTGESIGNPLQLSLASIDYNYLQKIQIILSNFGLSSSIHLLREAGPTLLPDGKGGKKFYDTKTAWRLIIGNKPDALVFEELTGFLSRKNVQIEDREYRNNTKKFATIKNIVKIDNEDVYCTTVNSPEHVWVCNSFITSNCSEIMLPSNKDESFVCDLSSMNLLYYDEWKNTDAVELLTFFLDAVMSEFIQKAKKIEFLDKAVNFAERHRALGIGWLGWHSYLQSKMIPFESMEAKYKNIEIAKLIDKQAYAASKRLVEEYGFEEPEVLKGYGRRNTTLCAIAPTKSSAFILGQVSEGIEPHRSNYYIKDLAKGKFTIKNTHLERLLESKGANTDEIWESISRNRSSVQHLVCLTPDEKEVFKTFIEISPKEIIIQAGARQKFIDQGQSLNLMISPHTPIKDINALYILAWELGVKSLYYQINVNAAQELSREINIMDCISCSA